MIITVADGNNYSPANLLQAVEDVLCVCCCSLMANTFTFQ